MDKLNTILSCFTLKYIISSAEAFDKLVSGGRSAFQSPCFVFMLFWKKKNNIMLFLFEMSKVLQHLKLRGSQL